MVKLTDVDRARDARRERDVGNVRTAPNEYNWRRRSRKERHYSEPKSLLELEELARKSVELMEKHTPKSEHNYHRAMDLLRLQYNMNFMIICEKCCTPHASDEIIAPER